ncbi:VMAP-C domain-containing protein [Streptomyces poriticola]|uniref:VMAP-C domain-containing protein n=1 Tax=Streptomyces poriticola TaxID=3120506 RepID=UPI002FCE2B9C
MPQRLATQDRRRRDILRRIVAVLGDSAALTDARGRQQWRRELAELLGGQPWAELPTPRQEFLEVVRVCEARPDGLSRLVEATALVAPPLEYHLTPLVEELYALQLYEGRDWTALRRALSLTLPELDTVVAQITGDRIRLPAHCTTAWQAFLHLSGRSTTPDAALPPGMLLLEHLALHDDLASHVGELQGWNDHFAELWGLADGDGGLTGLRGLLARRSTAAAEAAAKETQPVPGAAEHGTADGAAAARPVIRLYLKLAPDLAPVQGSGRRQYRKRHRYWVSARVKYAESSELHHAKEGDAQQPVPRAQVPAAVAELLSRMASLWHARAQDVVLEFFLPTELLNEPVEWWDRDPSLGYPNPLFSKYPEIVVHSLERLQRRDAHQVWRLRWARWKSARERAGAVHWCDRQGRSVPEYLQRLDATIGARQDVVAMVLSEPPATGNPAGLGEVRVGIDLGIPVFIHHRDAVSEQFHSMVRDGLSEGGLAGLPSQARQWKSDSATRANGSSQDPAQHLCVVWDDPEQLLSGGAGAPAAFIGGME